MANRIDLRRGAMREVLTSPEMRGAVRAEAERIARAARSLTGDEVVVAEGGRSRARAYVRRLGSGAAGEASDRALGRSIGGG